MGNKPRGFTIEPVKELSRKEKLRQLWHDKTTLPIALTIFLFITTLIIVWLLKSPQRFFKLKAAANQVSVVINPETTAMTGATAQEFQVIAVAEKAIGFIALELSFNPGLIQLTQEVTLTNTKLTQVILKTPLAEANVTGKIKIAVGLDPQQAADPPINNINLATLSMKAISSQPNTVAEINFVTSSFQVVATDTTVLEPLPGKSQITLNPTSGAKLFFSNPIPNNPQTVNTNFTVDLLTDTGGQLIYGVDAKLTFDKTKLQVVSLTQGTEVDFKSFPKIQFDNTAGTITVSANIGTGTDAAGITGTNLNLAHVTFKPIANIASTEVTYSFIANDRNDSNIVLKTTDPNTDPVDILNSVVNLTITIPTTTASPSPSPSASPSMAPSPSPSAQPSPSASLAPSPSPSPSLAPEASPQPMTFKFQLQGRARIGASQVKNITLTLYKNGAAGSTQSTLTSNAGGEINTMIIPGQYVFLAKIPGYLVKRFGNNTSPIIIDVGHQYLNLSSNQILGGDFNNDGEINEVDYTTSFLNYFNTNNALVDLDGSGQVNNLDFAVMRANWNLVNDTYQ